MEVLCHLSQDAGNLGPEARGQEREVDRVSLANSTAYNLWAERAGALTGMACSSASQTSECSRLTRNLVKMQFLI